jgi:error-prone DNA polymerase
MAASAEPPVAGADASVDAPPPVDAAPAYAELHVLSSFSFLRGASQPVELVDQAAALGYAALALTDECLARRRRAGATTRRAAGRPRQLITGAELHARAAARSWCCSPRNAAPATGRLCRLDHARPPAPSRKGGYRHHAPGRRRLPAARRPTDWPGTAWSLWLPG